jgi:tetratricopeptide (TPR) repeat protein/DNA-binding CsgD family transcriptional regulator
MAGPMKQLCFVLFVLIVADVAAQSSDTVEVRKVAARIREKRYWSTYPDSLLHFANKGLAIAESINDQYGVADMTRFLGIYYWSSGDHAPAMDHYLKSKAIYDKLGRKPESAQMLSNIGMVYARLGDNEKALRYYQQALSVMEKASNQDVISIASTLSSMGLLLRNHNDLSAATAMFLRAIELYEKAGDSLNLAGTLTNLATVYSRKKSYDSAILYNENAERLFSKLNNERGLVITHNNLATVALDQNQFDKALGYLNAAYSINAERGFFESQISTLLGLGQVKLGQREFQRANQFFEEAYAIAKAKSRTRLVDIYKGLSDASRGMQDYPAALEYYDRFIALRDSLYSQENASLIANLRISSELDRKNAEITLLEKDNRIEKLYRNIVFVTSVAVVALLGILLYVMFQKMRKDKRLLRQQAELHEAKQAVALAELNNQKVREEKLQRELEFRNRALTTYTLNLVQKNGMLDEVRGIVQDILKAPQQKENELKKLIRLIDYSFSLDRDWDGFKTYFEQVHPEFFKKLKATFPNLTATELKLCALIRLSLNIKESASVLSISPDSVKVSRHRVRKKLGLTSDDNLTEFILSI